jgi:hypothetical protein
MAKNLEKRNPQALAYIVNIHNFLNCDIDFNRQENSVLAALPSFEYLYCDFSLETFSSNYHRARLARVSVKKLNSRESSKKAVRRKYYQAQNLAKMEISQILTRCSNWVYYSIVEIDVFQRAVVYLYDPVTLRCLNHILLDPRYAAAFELYLSKEEKT